MSKNEARRHFGSVHIYWHGPDHCWDATPTGRRYVVRTQRRAPQARQQDDPPKWRESRSELLAADGEPAQTLKVQTSWEPRSEKSDTAAPAPASAAWSDRWVNVDQVAPIQMAAAASADALPVIGYESDTMVVASHGIVLVLFGSALIFVGVLHRFSATRPFPFSPRSTGLRS